MREPRARANGSGMGKLGEGIDRALEASVIGSYTRVGFAVRDALGHWDEAPLPRLDGRVVVITGATSGIGLAATRGLLALGATVELVARNAEKAATVRDRLVAENAGASIDITRADLGALADVRKAAAAIAERHPRVDVLIHDAGALDDAYGTSPEGTETTVATHVVGPYLLTRLLLPALRGASRGGGPARVIWVTSGGMYTEPLDVARLEMPRAGYDGVLAYARAKRAQATLVAMLGEELPPDEIVVHAMHPGWVDTPGVARSLPRFRAALRPFLRTPAQGADTIVYLAAANGPPVATTGKLWLDRKVRPMHLRAATERADTAVERAALRRWVEARAGLSDAPSHG